MSEDAKNLLGWFGKRKENVIQDGIRSHAIAVYDCINEMGLALRAMETGDSSGAMKCIERLFVNEREADSLEDDLCAQLSIGELSSQEREDLLYFVRETDDIANWSKEAALHVQLIKETKAVVPAPIWAHMVQVVSYLEAEVNYLMNAIKLLGTDSGEINHCIQGVKEEESRIDRANFDLTKEIYMSDMEPKAIMLATKVVDSLEMAADTCKRCSDTISILMVAKRL